MGSESKYGAYKTSDFRVSIDSGNGDGWRCGKETGVQEIASGMGRLGTSTEPVGLDGSPVE